MADIVPVAGNGLLDRRAFLRASGILITGYAVSPANAEPLSEPAWSTEPGTVVPAYGAPSKFEKAVVRTLSNPNGEPRNSHARTPHQQHDVEGHCPQSNPAENDRQRWQLGKRYSIEEEGTTETRRQH